MGRCITPYTVNALLKFFARVLGLLLLAVVVLAAWWYRDPILHTASRWLGPRPTALPPVADTAVGAPTPKALSTGESKLDALARAGGPDSVLLSPNETAALIGSGIDWSVRKSFDSLRVELLEGSLAVHARLDTRSIPPGTLGPLAGMLQPREPLRLAGPLTIAHAGTARWKLEEISVRGFPFPPPLVADVARRMAGADSTGAVPVKVPRAIGAIAIHPTAVILYRHAARP